MSDDIITCRALAIPEQHRLLACSLVSLILPHQRRTVFGEDLKVPQ
jgi:hypothetical protein